MFEDLEQIQIDKALEVPDIGEDFTNLPQGHLVKVTCGHRGLPNRA